MSKRTTNLVAALFLSVHAALLGYGATRHSPSIDEVGHMAAGLSHWHFGRFDLYKVNPPLVRLAATTPVALLRPATDWNGYSLLPGTPPEFECGERFIQANGERSFFFSPSRGGLVFHSACWAATCVFVGPASFTARRVGCSRCRSGALARTFWRTRR